MFKTETTFEAKVSVTFLDEDMAFEYFILGEWAKIFTKYHDLKEVAEDIAGTFMSQSETWNSKYRAHKWLEGYGTFVKDNINGYYLLDTELFKPDNFPGVIIITVEQELEAYHSEVVE